MISINSVTKQFEGVLALSNIDLTIENGTIYGLVGSNGSGKSTLLRLLAGIYYPEQGSIKVDGEAIFDNTKIKSQIAFLGDTPYFLPQSNLNEMAAFYESMYAEFDRAEYERLLGVFPLNRKARLSTFSKGMQRQAALILHLSTHPKILLLDEAFDGLDVVMRRVLTNLVIDGSEQNNMTVIISSHNLRELGDICDHIALIHEGKLLMSGDTENLTSSVCKLQAVFEGAIESSVFDELNALKFERNGSVVQLVARGEKQEILDFVNRLSPVFVECVEPTLEELFIFELEAIGYDVKNILS